MNRNKDVEYEIFRIFLKHIKRNKLYVTFRSSMDSSLMGDVFFAFGNRGKRPMTPFSYCKNKTEVVNKMVETVGKINVDSNEETLQMNIMHHVNNLLHNCIEPYISQPMILEHVGASIFDEVCREYLGDAFVDKTKELIDENKINAAKEAIMHYFETAKEGDYYNKIDKRLIELIKQMGQPSEAPRPSRWIINPYSDDDEDGEWF